MSLRKKISTRLRINSHQRFKEPVLVIESDDWGMLRHSGRFDEVAHIGKLKKWAYDDLESTEDLDDLYKVLGTYSDRFDHPFKITANFIVENPDFEKTIAANYKQLYTTPITQSPSLEKWKQGRDQGVFWPQYHGRFHFNFTSILEGIQKPDSTERALFNAGFHGGLNNLEGSDWNDHSEYVQWKKSKELPIGDLKDWISKGLDIFEEVFGFKSQSVIAPHYVFTPNTAEAFRLSGLKYIQGGNHQYFPSPGGQMNTRKFPLGSNYYKGLTMLCRNVKFEPARGKAEWDVDAAYQACLTSFKKGVPAVLDSHRINYSGRMKEEGLQKLNSLLNMLEKHKPVVLSSDELGEAIAGNGKFISNTSKKEFSLSPLGTKVPKAIANKIVN